VLRTEHVADMHVNTKIFYSFMLLISLARTLFVDKTVVNEVPLMNLFIEIQFDVDELHTKLDLINN
jgi:hypothetical protein